jgi:tRNA G10  N-methylase Trm11
VPDPSSRRPIRPASVWLTGQQCSRDQRRGRYTHASIAHPGKMLPAIARHAIQTWTRRGDLVLDPMAGIGTTLVEAIHLGRDALGVEYEHRWARHAADNIALATQHGATGTAQIWTGDSRNLTQILPPDLRGKVALIITSPPYGPSTHGHVRTPGPKTGKINKIDHRYGNNPDNLAYSDPSQLAAGFSRILAQSAAFLRPAGTVMVTARPYRRGHDLIDIPGMVIAAGDDAGLHLIDRCVGLLAGIRDGKTITRASFFQQHNIRLARTAGDPQWLIAHEDILVFTPKTPPVPHTEDAQ